jgi:hypothetical protein
LPEAAAAAVDRYLLMHLVLLPQVVELEAGHLQSAILELPILVAVAVALDLTLLVVMVVRVL